MECRGSDLAVAVTPGRDTCSNCIPIHVFSRPGVTCLLSPTPPKACPHRRNALISFMFSGLRPNVEIQLQRNMVATSPANDDLAQPPGDRAANVAHRDRDNHDKPVALAVAGVPGLEEAGVFEARG